MSMGRSETDEEEQAEMLVRAMTEKNVTKIEKALAKTKKHGKGFVLSSHFYKSKPISTSPQERHQTQSHTPLPIVVGSPIGSPVPSRKQSFSKRSPPSRTKSAGTRQRKPEVIEESPRPHSAYITEYLPPPIKVDMAIQSDETDRPPQPPQSPEPESPAPPPGTPDANQEAITEQPQAEVTEQQLPQPANEEKENIEPATDDEPPLAREEPIGDEANATNECRISDSKFRLLGLPRRPQQFQYNVAVPQTNKEKNPQNPAPEHPNIWITRVPKQGGNVHTPFYMQILVPDDALRGDVIMKFETQSYTNSKLELNDTDKLCSDIIDINMKPLAFCLHQKAKIKVRILEDCVNQFDEVTFISARNFKWSRKPTYIETSEVNGQTLYYAVTETQQLGKFAVITTRKLDRFVMTSAGGLFTSTVLPNVSITLNEGVLNEMAHLVEVSIQDTRQEAIIEASKAMAVKGVKGELVACSPIIDITKEIMGKTGVLEDGVSFPQLVRLTVPVTTFCKQPNDIQNSWKKPILKIMQKVGTTKIGENANTYTEYWNDISANCQLFDPVNVQKGGKVALDARIPCQLLILVFDETSAEWNPIRREIDDMCEEIEQCNQIFNVAIMVHQKVDKPEIVNIHVVPARGQDLIIAAMRASGEWKMLGEPTTKVFVKEREHLSVHFKGDIKLTINQMDSEIVFHSRRWQGHQYQIEATDEGYANSNADVINGAIELVQKQDDASKLVHSSKVTLEHRKAKPYHPTVIVRPLPKVSVMREYKLKWLKCLSEAEKLKYQSINTP